MSTIRKYIEAKLERFNINCSDVEVQALMVQHAIIGNEPLGADGLKKSHAALASILSELLVIASVTEGGYSIAWNIEGIKAYITMLQKQAGVEADNAMFGSITSISDTW